MAEDWEALRQSILEGIPEHLPPSTSLDPSVDHAPARKQVLSTEEKHLAVCNALRYIPPVHHEVLYAEFMDELETFGRILMRRYRPTGHPMRAHPIKAYPAKSPQAAAIMLMIQNNLDPAVAQFPHELITYGGNGSVFQNWAQYRLAMKYLSEMDEDQTLVMYSGHPMGLFPSSPEAPRVVVTNGMVIPNHSSPTDYERMNALGVTQYGQMTAGSYMYIGPQGIVHGTTITLLNAARMHLGLADDATLAGVTFVTSGLGGMSGAQAKAATIAGAACIIAEANAHAAHKRHDQGWLTDVTDDVDQAIDLMIEAASTGQTISVGYVGNIVRLWERLVERNVTVDLGSDQTSLHNPFQGGYFPVDRSFEASTVMMSSDPEALKMPSVRRFGAMPMRSTPWLNAGCTSGITATPFSWRPLEQVPMSFHLTVRSDTPVTWRTSWGRCALTTVLDRTGGYAPVGSHRIYKKPTELQNRSWSPCLQKRHPTFVGKFRTT